jgi:hypothetical protein
MIAGLMSSLSRLHRRRTSSCSPATGTARSAPRFRSVRRWEKGSSAVLVPTDASARDLDGDGAVDIVVSAAARENDQYTSGVVYVLKGRGDGTFGPPVSYATGGGAFQIVVGDFTHDGRVDIATANRSFIRWEGCGIGLQSSDSISILSGSPIGFGAPTTFALDDQSVIDGTFRFQNSAVSLNTSDLDRDRLPDLIASYGAVLLTRAPAANRPPVANAGPDVALLNDRQIFPARYGGRFRQPPA